MNTVKIKRLTLAVIFSLLLIITGVNSILLLGTAQKPNTPPLQHSWKLDTFAIASEKVWDSEVFSINHTGQYSDAFNYTYGYSISETEWVEETISVEYQSNYSYVSEITLLGNVTIDIETDSYRVDVSYGQDVNFTWLAVKNGTYELEYYIDGMQESHHFENDYYKTYDITYNKYNMTTDELLDTWTDQSEDSGTWVSHMDPISLDSTLHTLFTYEFSLPLILIFQIYKLGNEKIAWAEMFCDFLVYDDLDKNGIYSVGEVESSTSVFSLGASNEFKGQIIPWAINSYLHSEVNYTEPSPTTYSTWENFPNDKTIVELANTIEFTEPQGSGTLDWGIKYPEYPLKAIFALYSTPQNASYADTSPGNYSYAFSYNVDENKTILDVTSDLPKLSNSNLYDEVQGLSLAFPQYTFFMSSSEITETNGIVITAPSSVFNYEIEGMPIAQINMGGAKSNYMLRDYPFEGESRTYQSIGSTISKLVVSGLENRPITPKNYFIDMIFALREVDIIKNDPDFDTELYSMEMQNYPMWSGEHVVHDPQFIAYINPESEPDPDPTSPRNNLDFIMIVSFIGIGIVTGGIVAVLFLIKRRK